MTSLLPILEEWPAYQDYVWFVTILAWNGVLYFVLRFARDQPDREARGAIATMAMAGALGASVELALNLFAAGRNFPALAAFTGGIVGAIWVASLAWLALSAAAKCGADVPFAQRPRTVRIALGVIASLPLLLGVVRFFHPIVGGVLLGSCAIAAALVLAWQLQQGRALPQMSPRERAWLAGGLAACVAAIGVATWESWAGLRPEGRGQLPRITLPAASCQLLAAALFCRAWREPGRQSLPAESYLRTAVFRLESRVAGWMLVGWLAAGLVLTAWLSTSARRRFETQLLRRVKTAAALVDRGPLRAALGSGIPSGQRPTADQPGKSASPEALAQLRTQLRAIKEANPDAQCCRILTLRNGWLVAPVAADFQPNDARIVVVIRAAHPRDLAELAAHQPALEPQGRHAWEGDVDARVPLVDPQTGFPLGWLSLVFVPDEWRFILSGTHFQVLSFVALGASFWALAFAYRLRTLEQARVVERAERESHVSRARSTFLSQVSHELREPLQALLGIAELLALAPLIEPHHSRAGALRTQGALLLRLVNDLLDLGAIQSGIFRPSEGPTDLRRVLAESIDPLRPRAENRGLELWGEVDAALPTWIESDGARLRQVIFNLAGNAIKYTDRGRVGVMLRAVARPDHRPELELRVTDTEPGLPRPNRSTRFRPEAHHRGRGEAEGLGLGLSFAQSICRALGGTLEVEGDGRSGATFVARWPLKPCAAPPGAVIIRPVTPRAKAAAGLAGWRVLVADDNTALREMLSTFLHDQGCVIEVAVDGTEALARAQTGGHDVMLLDLSMPRIDGCEVARILRRDEPPGRHLLVVGLSAHADTTDCERALAAGMDCFLPKPVKLASLAMLLVQMRTAMTVASAAWQMPASLRRQLCALFASEWPTLRLALKAARDTGDRAVLQDRSHYLKNSADVLGDNELSKLCLHLEDAARTGNDATAHALVGAIEQAGTRLAQVAQTVADFVSPAFTDESDPDRP